MDIFGNLFDKEGMVSGTIENCLENLSEELGCKKSELFIMIKPTKDEFDDENTNFKNWVYQMIDGKPKLVREISLTEILNG
jgi:hypothetical protein